MKHKIEADDNLSFEQVVASSSERGESKALIAQVFIVPDKYIMHHGKYIAYTSVLFRVEYNRQIAGIFSTIKEAIATYNAQ